MAGLTFPDGRPLFLPTATAPNGIHVSAELRVNAGQLRAYGIHWAAASMERAATHIDALEDERAQLAQSPEEGSCSS